MGTSQQRHGFTLIEVLIVVVITAILAAMVIPRFGSTTDDAKKSTLVSTTHSLRTQIEVYKNHHGKYPALINNGLPQLVTKTDITGAETADGPFGPYYDSELPRNPVDLCGDVYPAASDPPSGPTSEAKGWQYHEASGGIWPNNPAFWSE